MNLSEAAHAQILRQVVGRPRRHPHLPAQRVHRFDRRDEIVVARDQHGRVERADRGVVDHLGDEPRVHALLGRVLVLHIARRAVPGASYAQLALDEIARAELEPFQEAFDQGRRVRRHPDVVVGTREDRAGAADGLRNPGGEPVVVDAEGLVVSLKRPVEVLAVKENADLHGQLPGNHIWLMVDDAGFVQTAV